MKRLLTFLALALLFATCHRDPLPLAVTNNPPSAHAGTQQTIILPTNKVVLDGSKSADPENGSLNYAWTKIAGPSSYVIVDPRAAQTEVTNLVAGTYQFELKVTDAGTLFDRDTIRVTVMAVNQHPVCTNCRIVFVSDRDGNAEIYSCNADGSNITRLTNDAATDNAPAWSPDRSQIAFVSDRTGNPEIYIMNADGSNVARRTFSGRYNDSPTWSPDGNRLAYSSLSSGSANIWVVDAAGGSPSLLVEKPGWEGHASWSPDGTKMVLVSDWYLYDFVYDIFMVNSDGTNFKGLTGDIFDQVDYLHPCWSPSGTKIAMAISEGLAWISTTRRSVS